MLEHLIEPAAALAEMRRLAAPGGRVVVSVPNEALINAVKQAALRLPLGRRLLRGEGYEASERMDDEWHLHSFGRALLEELVARDFTLEELCGIPSRLVPLRFVARLRPRH